jgi:hypothetical protein
MASINSIPHTDCRFERGPGKHDESCGICKETKGADEATICHTACLHSLHEGCFTDWSRVCQFRQQDVTCSACR